MSDIFVLGHFIARKVVDSFDWKHHGRPSLPIKPLLSSVLSLLEVHYVLIWRRTMFLSTVLECKAMINVKSIPIELPSAQQWCQCCFVPACCHFTRRTLAEVIARRRWNSVMQQAQILWALIGREVETNRISKLFWVCDEGEGVKTRSRCRVR